MIKALFFDVDNTLYCWKEHRFMPEALKAIKKLQKKIPYAAAEPMRAIIIGTLYVAGILYKQLTITVVIPNFPACLK